MKKAFVSAAVALVLLSAAAYWLRSA